AVKRYAKTVTEASGKVCGRSARDGYGTARIVDKTSMSAFETDYKPSILDKWMQVQSKAFAKKKTAVEDEKSLPVSSKLKYLCPFLDSKSILRVGGSLKNTNLDYDAKHQIILPNCHKITRLIFEFYHKKHLHVGAQGLFHQVRLNYWPLIGKSTARMIMHSCVTCFKNKPVIAEQIIGDLP
ncbi:Transposable element Tcb2 transposase, partial [Araneus ventricosus]